MNPRRKEPELPGPNYVGVPFMWAMEFLKHQGFAVLFAVVILWFGYSKGSVLIDTHLAFLRLQSEQMVLQTRSLQAIEKSNERQESKLEEIRGAVGESEHNRVMEHSDLMKEIKKNRSSNENATF